MKPFRPFILWLLVSWAWMFIAIPIVCVGALLWSIAPTDSIADAIDGVLTRVARSAWRLR